MEKSTELSNYLTDEASIEKRTALFNKICLSLQEPDLSYLY